MQVLCEQEIRKAIEVLKPDGQLFEVRIINSNKRVSSGYFRDADTLIRCLKSQNLAGCNIYFTINALNDACYDRKQKNHFEQITKATTSDGDIIGYDYLFIDIDPKRPADTSSTDAQIGTAKTIGNKVFEFLRDMGFEIPIVAYSGNGVHLLYKINLNNTPENKQLIEKCLKTLDVIFSNNNASVDTSNHNPARICKLYGSLAQKGTSSEERPHRMSYIAKYPKPIKTTDVKYLQKLCDKYPKEEKPQYYNRYSPREFDLQSWLDKYGLRYQRVSSGDVDKYILDHCPFDSNHKGKDAAIFQCRNGAIGFHCFHASCQGKTWKDVRVMYEPDAYEKRNMEFEKRMYGSHNRDRKEQKHITEETNKPVFYSPLDILDLPEKDVKFIRTGIDKVDMKLRGLIKPGVSVISGLRASGKSSIISQIALEAINHDNNVAVFSGELTERNFFRWMFQQAAGKAYVRPSMYEGYYNVPREYQEQIAEWMDGRLWLYNNDYGNDFGAILEQFEKIIEEKKLDLLILDNLMAFDISGMGDKYDAQSKFVLRLADLAKKHDIHIMFVAHPRKAQGFLRLDDISGTADLANAVDTAFIIHRNNTDFQKRTGEYFGWKIDAEIYQCDNIIEIAKDRDGGTQDEFVSLYYERETRRLKNSFEENKIYRWRKEKKEGTGFYEEINMETPFDVG